ncbi:uncharacterized protein BO72DRAFT_73260 [Aspergillus fijiensis CBS 313.89]|uniref:Uncharacterized protein n=1 Tax=Aspergillus fijiensis CBS 313.89 TaxID=1448319 RepID=A0A8G1RV53_9EURO|nr:uncharacterized protein BO72DRAFT_73260 [Aspergillus fijiensis CBS 313.89]RAK78415.1 hypothetical protein BO72DRAFT_73260 [Aspergillus fijiensis CBS 313.89]
MKKRLAVRLPTVRSCIDPTHFGRSPPLPFFFGNLQSGFFFLSCGFGMAVVSRIYSGVGSGERGEEEGETRESKYGESVTRWLLSES